MEVDNSYSPKSLNGSGRTVVAHHSAINQLPKEWEGFSFIINEVSLSPKDKKSMCSKPLGDGDGLRPVACTARQQTCGVTSKVGRGLRVLALILWLKEFVHLVLQELFHISVWAHLDPIHASLLKVTQLLFKAQFDYGPIIRNP